MLRTLSIFMILLLAAGTVMAQSTTKNISAGAGVYVNVWEEDDEKDNFEGYAFTASFALSPGAAVRGHLYFTKHEDEDDVSLDGYDAQLMLGSNLVREGFKIYALGGYWSESLEIDASALSKSSASVESDFSGLMAGLGIGYNWESATLDFWVAWKDPGEYKDLIEDAGGESDVTMGAGAITFGLRF